VTFEQFVRERGPGLRAALVAAYGPQIGLDAASEALAYGWEQWARLRTMENPAGYLFRVG
jgi:RNA polymerase sigma-70 factor (ECF subfamily)